MKDDVMEKEGTISSYLGIHRGDPESSFGFGVF